MIQPADSLLVDLGNTSAKLRLASHARLLGKTRRLPTAKLLQADAAASWHEVLAGWQFNRVVLSSVVPAATRTVQTIRPEVLLVNVGANTGVNLRGYPGVKTLGADRLANAAGALALYGPGPLVVVDFGTAATFNALDSSGRFLGGVIAPGLCAVTDYLPGRTAQLPPIRLEGALPRAIGRTTRAAMRAGALLGYRGLVREILDGLRAELGDERVRVVATGGDARFLSRKGMLAFDAVDPDLTLQGLRIIAARNARGTKKFSGLH